MSSHVSLPDLSRQPISQQALKVVISVDRRHESGDDRGLEGVMKSCKLISGGESYDGKQGLSYFSGISKESAEFEKLCMHIVTIPPGALGQAALSREP